MMQELVPRLLQSLPLDSEATADPGRASTDNPSPRPTGRKRPASKELPDPPQAPTHRHVDREGGGSAGVDDFAESSESRQKLAVKSCLRRCCRVNTSTVPVPKP